MQTKKKICTTDIVFKRKMIFFMNSIYQLKWREYDKIFMISQSPLQKQSPGSVL